MKTLRAIVLLGALAAVVCSGGTAYAASLSGHVGDSYLTTPIQGAHVEVINGDSSSNAVVASATTLVDGSYHVSGVPDGSYLVYFSDPLGRYFPQWYDHASVIGDAAAIDMAGSAAYVADADLDAFAVKVRATLSAAALDDPAMANSFLGDTVSLSTSAQDAIWGDPITDLRVILQQSTDRRTWTDVGPASHDNYDGTYQAQFAATVAGSRYYRFAIHDAPDAEATSSADVAVSVVGHPTSWSEVWIDGGWGAEATTTVGSRMAVHGVLIDGAGHPISYASGVTLEYSYDGVVWNPTWERVDPGANGAYAAFAGESAPLYRFHYPGGGNVWGSVSRNLVFRMPWKVQYLSTSPSKPRANRTFTLSGIIRPRADGKKLKLQIQRWNGRRWADYRTVWAGTHFFDFESTTFSAKTKLRAGRYRVRAIAAADAYRLEGSSGWTGFSAR